MYFYFIYYAWVLPTFLSHSFLPRWFYTLCLCMLRMHVLSVTIHLSGYCLKHLYLHSHVWLTHYHKPVPRISYMYRIHGNSPILNFGSRIRVMCESVRFIIVAKTQIFLKIETGADRKTSPSLTVNMTFL